jgi:hypothetical protein
MKFIRNIAFLFFLNLFVGTTAMAQCVNSPTPSCGVYESCFATACQCDSSEFEYFKSYGKKYCEVFLDLPNLSPKGKEWRDSTLRCLQETIVPLLPPDGQAASCDCKAMQLQAFDSHVACYTQSNNSICSLEVRDWRAILDAADVVASLKDQKSRKQMVEVARICMSQVGGDVKEVMGKLIKKLTR